MAVVVVVVAVVIAVVVVAVVVAVVEVEVVFLLGQTKQKKQSPKCTATLNSLEKRKVTYSSLEVL